MANILWGIPVILVCSAAYLNAWRLTKKNRYDLALLCVVLSGLVLRTYVGADANLHDWDERYHALVGKHLAQHWLKPTLYEQPLFPFDYKDWTSNHVWVHKQPLSLWLIALSIKLFGLHAFAVRIPAILLTTVGIKLIYDLRAKWYSRQTGIIAAFLFSIHGLIIELAAGRAGTDCVDAVFLFFVLLAVWASQRAIDSKSYSAHVLVGGIIGLGILTKWLPALIAVPIWAMLAFPVFKEQRIKMLGCFACIMLAATAVALPWQLYIFQKFPEEAQWEHAYNSRHFFYALEGHEGNFFYHVDHLRRKYGELIYLPIIWATWKFLKEPKGSGYALLFWIWGPYIFFSLAATKMEAYTIIAAPAVFIITAIAFQHIEETVATGAGYKYLRIAACFSLVALPVRYSLERVKPFTVMERNPAWQRRIDSLRRSPANSDKTVVFNCKHPIETMFFTNCVAYERDLSPAEAAQLSARGCIVVNLQR